SPWQLEKLRNNKSVDISVNMTNARLRVNIFTTLRGISMAIRLLPGIVPTVEALNLHPFLHEIPKYPSGLVLICGPTGVGKTSTIAAVINDMNKNRDCHIVTIENPIEYAFQSNRAFIQQRELGDHVPSFAQGLQDVLRENPDVIIVGELRDPETMHLTMNAAESGHLVIATMHASSPEEAIYRLCNAVPPEFQAEIRYQLSLTLRVIIVQQLIHYERAGFRVPLLTIALGTSSFRNLIRENKLNQLAGAIEMSRGEGMFTAERYKQEFLDSREHFVPYSQSFYISSDVKLVDNVYHSPLTDDRAHVTEVRQEPKEREPIRPVARHVAEPPQTTGEEADHGEMVTIDEDLSLSEVIEGLHYENQEGAGVSRHR
ncbi:MAG: type IV pilus twitching motility protein PilT, partial [Anaerovoracaceae bacterium]